MQDHARTTVDTPSPALGARDRELPSMVRGTTPAHASRTVAPTLPALETEKWTWGLRRLSPSELRVDPRRGSTEPRAGDVVVVRIEKIGYHSALVGRDNRKLRIYPGDRVVGVFGHRYATDAYEAVVDGTEDLSLLTAGGMIGTVRSAHREMGRATSVSFVGYGTDLDGRRINLKERLFHPDVRRPEPKSPLIVVVGTGMNSGKTTVLSQTLHGLSRQGLRVAAGKLTGSVSNRDVDEMGAADAVSVLDFSDFGFPSTYLADPGELAALWRTILERSAEVRPDVMLMEIADGLLQRETSLILRDPEFRRRVRGVLFAADSSLAALAGLEELRRLGYSVLGVSGAFTSAPLFVREFESRSGTPVLPSTGEGAELARRVLDLLPTPAWNGSVSSFPPALEPEFAPVLGDLRMPGQ